jgi:hypothetical protein
MDAVTRSNCSISCAAIAAAVRCRQLGAAGNSAEISCQ